MLFKENKGLGPQRSAPGSPKSGRSEKGNGAHRPPRPSSSRAGSAPGWRPARNKGPLLLCPRQLIR